MGGSRCLGDSTFTVGDAVAVYGPWGCGHCRSCQLSAENYCERAGELRKLAPGIGHDGGMAGFMRVPERLLIPLGGLDPVDAAPLTDAGLTPYHAIKRSLPLLVPGSTAVVIGAGGLGHLAIQILRTLTTSRIIVVDTNQTKLDQALELGADEALLPADDASRAHPFGYREPRCRAGARPRRIGRLADARGGLQPGRRPPHGGRDRRRDTALQLLRGPVRVLRRHDVLGNGCRAARGPCARATGRLHVNVERFPLERALEAYERMRAGTIAGRAVITPNE